MLLNLLIILITCCIRQIENPSHSFNFLPANIALCRGLRKAWQKKIPQRSEDDFLLANQAPKGGRLAAKTRQSKTFAA